MTREEKLKDILDHPEKHKHTWEELVDCCLVGTNIDFKLMNAHLAVGYNGGAKCDVIEGPCSCGAWH